MNAYQTVFENGISEAEKLRALLKKDKSKQVKSIDERSIIKATSMTWFSNHRPSLLQVIGEPDLKGIDDLYNLLLTLSDKFATRSKFDKILKKVKLSLSELRSKNITKVSASNGRQTNDVVPDFGSIVGDKDMIPILTRRWNECGACVKNNTPLAATVMMGGLLESLLLTRFLKETDKTKIFKTKIVPKDKTGTPLQFKDWVLKNYIEVSHELGWISQTEKDLGEVLRDYRNYIHPFKEKSHGITIEPTDASILWELTKSISRQILTPKT